MYRDDGAVTGFGSPEIAVLDTLPMFRLGVLATLGRGGTELQSNEELATWTRHRGGVLLYTVPDDDEPVVPMQLAGRHDLDVIAVLEPFSVARAVRALQAGASHVVARTASASDLRRVVDETVSGRVSLSHDVLRALTAVPRGGGGLTEITDQEMAWLRALAAGSGVSSVARDAHLSERAMYRRLRVLYRRLGVDTRTQALILARSEGWL